MVGTAYCFPLWKWRGLRVDCDVGVLLGNEPILEQQFP
jgi:hypothetical protein